MGAFGFEVPTSDLVVKPSTFVISIVLGVVVTFVAALLPARRARAHRADRRAARLRGRVAAPRPADRHRRRRSRCSARSLLLVGLFGDGGIQLVGARRVRPLHRGRGARAGDRPAGRAGARRAAAALARHAGPLAAENAVRNPRRTASTAAALMIGVALVGLITIFASSLKLSISGQIDQAFRGDLVVVGDAGPGSSFSPAMADRIAKVPGRRGREPAAVRRVRGRTARASSCSRRARTSSTACSTSTPGRVTSPRSSRTRSRCRRRCSTTSTGSSVRQMRTKFPRAGRGAGDDRRRLRPRPARGPRRLLHVARRLRQAVQRDRRQPGVHRARPRHVDQGRAAEDRGDRQAVPRAPRSTTSAGSRQQFETQINQILGLVFALLFLAIFIALLGIMNTLLLSIVERTREIGLLRAVGMTRKQVRTLGAVGVDHRRRVRRAARARPRDLLRVGDGRRRCTTRASRSSRCRRSSSLFVVVLAGLVGRRRRGLPGPPGVAASTSSRPSPPSRPNSHRSRTPGRAIRARRNRRQSGYGLQVDAAARSVVGDARDELVVGRCVVAAPPTWCSAGLERVDAVERPARRRRRRSRSARRRGR